VTDLQNCFRIYDVVGSEKDLFKLLCKTVCFGFIEVADYTLTDQYYHPL